MGWNGNGHIKSLQLTIVHMLRIINTIIAIKDLAKNQLIIDCVNIKVVGYKVMISHRYIFNC
jgi:hypothetical protein